MSSPTDLVIKRGKIFSAGEYPDHDFSLTRDEMAAAVAAFSPVPVRDAHPLKGLSLLKDKMGTLQAVSIDPENPDDLLGEVAIPRWLDEVLEGTDLQVSAEWGRHSKRLQGLGLLSDPQIPDARVFAAFAKATHSTPTGQSVLQSIHDQTARAGAVCNAPASFAAKHEAEATQQIHNLTVEHGATCAAMGPNDRVSAYPAFFSKRKEHPMSWFERLLTWRTQGAQGDPPAPSAAELTELSPVLFGGTAATVTPPAPAAAPPAAAPPDPQIRTLRLENIGTKAEQWADREILAHRATPAERDGLIAEFSQAATDDMDHGVAFSQSGKSRVQLLQERHAVRPAHALTQEQLNSADPELQALFNQANTAGFGAKREVKPLSAEDRKRYLGMTDLGREAMNGRQN